MKGSSATGTGMKVGTSDYMPFGSTFADIHAKDTTNAGVCTIGDVSSVKLTIVNDTVGSENETVVAQAYSATAQNLSSVTGINGTGTHKYVGSRTSTATLLADTVDVTKDVTVYVGYVKTGEATVNMSLTSVDITLFRSPVYILKYGFIASGKYLKADKSNIFFRICNRSNFSVSPPILSILPTKFSVFPNTALKSLYTPT